MRAKRVRATPRNIRSFLVAQDALRKSLERAHARLARRLARVDDRIGAAIKRAQTECPHPRVLESKPTRNLSAVHHEFFINRVCRDCGLRASLVLKVGRVLPDFLDGLFARPVHKVVSIAAVNKLALYFVSPD